MKQYIVNLINYVIFDIKGIKRLTSFPWCNNTEYKVILESIIFFKEQDKINSGK